MNLHSSNLVFIDAHVHLHHCFDLVPFLEVAHANFKRIAQQFYPDDPCIGVLFLTEGAMESGFDRLLVFGGQQRAGDAGSNRWYLQRTEENISMFLSSADEKALMVIAGRQIVSEERLEVLAIGTRRQFEEGVPVQELIRQVAQAGALPVVPWGFGKWMGARGKLVKKLLQNPELPPFFLGDSANHPAFWPPSSLFRLAEEKGIRNLPGSDPLPFPHECRRPGSFGFILQGSLNRSKPAQYLKEKLLDRSTSIQPFGRGETPVRFVRNQLGMQYLKLVERDANRSE